MNIQFKYIKIKNFMSLVNETINLEDLGVVLVKGINNYDKLFKSNGSGKSAIFDSILWVLTGSTSRGSTNVSNININPTGAFVEIGLNIDSDEFVITRTDGYENHGKSLKIIKNNEDISGSTFTKSKDILKQQLSFVNYDILTSIIILSQGLPGRLSSLKPSDRKSRLEYLSNTEEVLNNINNKMVLANSDLSSKLSECNLNLTRINTSLTVNKSTIDSCNLKIKSIRDYEQSESKLTEDDIKKYNDEINEYKDNIVMLKDKYNSVLKLESELITKKTLNKNKLLSVERELKEIKVQYNSLSNNVCPFCKSVITSAEELKSHLSDKLLELKKTYVELNNEKSELDQMIVPDSNKYSKLINEYESKINSLTSKINEYSKRMASIDSYLSTIEDCNNSIESLNKELEVYTNKLKSINRQFEIYNFFKSVISRKFRNFLLNGVIEYLNKRLKYYSGYLFSNKFVYLESSGNNINIRLGDNYFEDLSGGEGRRVDIILQLAQRDLSKSESGFSCNLLVLDEILDYLDSDGISSVLSMIEKESSLVNSLMIVTHKEDVSIPYDSKLIVVKDENQLSHIRSR